MLPKWKWRCCSGRPLRGNFCPDCGAAAPTDKTTPVLVADDLEAEANTWYKNAATLENTAESIKVEHVLTEKIYKGAEYSQTWGDKYRHAIETAAGQRKRADKLMMYCRVIRDLIAEVKALTPK